MSLADNFREKKYDGKNKPDLNVKYNTKNKTKRKQTNVLDCYGFEIVKRVKIHKAMFFNFVDLNHI
jgi:hypothetical protein